MNPLYFDQDFADDLYVHALDYKPPEQLDPDVKFIPPKERLHLFLDAEMIKIVIPSLRRIAKVERKDCRKVWEIPYDFSRFATHRH